MSNYPATETIWLERSTFGTSLEFSIFSGDTMEDTPASSFDQIVLKSYALPKKDEYFYGNVDEVLSSTTSNIVHYTFKQDDTLKSGVFDLKLELMTLDGADILTKEVVSVGRLKINE